MESKSFFWGMTIQPDKRYAQVVAEPFHVSKACLEPSSVKKGGDGGGKPVTSVYLESDNDEFLICSLTSSNLNENLDLNFNRGEKICIRTEGGGIIHLTGYLMESPEFDFDDMGEEEESDLEDEESETEEVESKKPKKGDKNDVTAAKKISPLDKLLADMKKGEVKGKGKKAEEVTAEIEKAEKMKKILGSAANGNDSDSDDDDSSDIDDDSSDDDDDMLDTTDMLDLEAEEDSDDSDDDEGEEEEEEDSDDEEEKPAKKAAETPKAKEQPKASPAKGAEMSAKKEKKKSKEAETPPPKSAQKKEADKSAVNTPAVTESGKKKKKDKEQQAEKTPAKKEEGKEAKNTPKNKENGQANGAAAATPGKTPKKTLKGGLVVEDIRVGSGPEVKPGKMVGMYYEGRLKSNNKQFDACKEGAKPFKFRLGKGEVIKGWDIGIEGMKVGGKRRLICPPALAYGVKGAPPTIPSNATLVFDVECKFVQ